MTPTLQHVRGTAEPAVRAARVHLVVGGALIALALLGGCGGGDAGGASAEQTAAGVAAQPVGKIINVEVRLMRPRVFTSTIRVTGTIEAVHDAIISAQESGAVERFLVDKGSHVRAGQPIAKLDDRLLRARVREAEAAAASARDTFERRRRLWNDEHVGSELTYLTAQHEADRAAAALEALRTRLARATIVAPFDGVFDEKHLDVGEMAVPGAPIARVIGIDELKVVGGVPERYASDVTTETHATVTFDVLPSVEIECPVDFVGSSIDPASRTFTVELRIENPEGIFKPAMVANIELVRERLDGVLVAPQTAVTRGEHGYQVFVVVDAPDAARAAARPVEIGPSRAGEVVILDGLEPGDRLITLGQVDDQDLVRVAGGGGGGGGGDDQGAGHAGPDRESAEDPS